MRLFLLFFLVTLRLGAQTWTEVAPGIWKTRIGKPESYDLLTAAAVSPDKKGLTVLGPAAFPLNRAEVKATTAEGKTYLRFPLQKQEQLYGFGLQFQHVHQRGRIFNLHVDHYGNADNGRTHAPVPFYVSSEGYGVFINSARYLTVYAGSAVRTDSPNPPPVQDRNTDPNWSAHPYSDAVEVLVPAAGVEVYVFAGPKTLDAIRRFILFQGGGCLPPRWGLGFTQRVHRLYTADQVLKEAALFEEKQYPLDFIGLEPGWQSASYPCTFEWDKTRFPDPASFVNTLGKKKVRVNLWTNPYVSPQAPLYPAIKPYAGSHSVWVGAVPDLTIPAAKNVYWDKFDREHVSIGVSGYKIDEVDGGDAWLWPDVATFPSGHSAEQIRQTYGLLVQQQSTELYHRKNQRTYGLVRASNGGGASFPYVIYNDNYSHQDFITALINSGYSGVLWTPEVRASKTGEEWLRRMQTVCFSPMAMINAWAGGTQPWSFPEVADQVKAVAQLRMQMMPYWYSEFAKYHFQGVPPFRSMQLEEGFAADIRQEKTNTNLEENPYAVAVSREIRDQYMAGESLLVAPLFTGQTSRKVVLPKGKWYDFYTGNYAGDGEVITVEPGLDKIPVFVKDGGIIPFMPPLLHAPAAGEKTDLEIRVYGSKERSYELYDDDGETYDYEKGRYSWRKITVRRQADGKLSGTVSSPGPGLPDSFGRITFRFMTN